MKSLVNSLTILRIILAPCIFISSSFLENYWLAFILFTIAAFTDYFDGMLARRFGIESRLGAALDPIADKVLLAFTLIAVIIITGDRVVALMAAFIFAREFWVSLLRELNSSLEKVNATKVTYLAKIKTSVQFIALSMYFLGEAANLAMVTFLANFFLFLSVLLAYKSAFIYNDKTLNKSIK